MILNDEQRMLRDAIADFLSREAPVDALRATRDADTDLAGTLTVVWSLRAGAPAARMQKMTAAWASLAGYGHTMQETGRTLCASPLLSSAIHAQAVIRHCGSTEQIERRLPALMSGECVATVAMQEGNHFHTLPRQTRRDGNTISGDKTLVMDAGAADYLIVSLDAADELCLAVVPRDADGVTLHSQKLMAGSMPR